MPAEALIEQRLSAVEAAVAELQRRLSPSASMPDWLGQVTGSFKDEPAFAEVVSLGRAIREADRPGEDEGQ